MRDCLQQIYARLYPYFGRLSTNYKTLDFCPRWTQGKPQRKTRISHSDFNDFLRTFGAKKKPFPGGFLGPPLMYPTSCILSVYVYQYVSVYMYACMHICMYVYTYVRMNTKKHHGQPPSSFMTQLRPDHQVATRVT